MKCSPYSPINMVFTWRLRDKHWISSPNMPKFWFCRVLYYKYPSTWISLDGVTRKTNRKCTNEYTFFPFDTVKRKLHLQPFARPLNINWNEHSNGCVSTEVAAFINYNDRNYMKIHHLSLFYQVFRILYALNTFQMAKNFFFKIDIHILTTTIRSNHLMKNCISRKHSFSIHLTHTSKPLFFLW